MKTRKARAVICPGFSKLHSFSECRELIWLLGLGKAVLQEMVGCKRAHHLWPGHGAGVGWKQWSEAPSNSHASFTLDPSRLLVGRWL